MEWLGNEAYAYIPFEAPPEVREQLEQLERDLDGEALRTQLVIGLSTAPARSREGDEAEIWVDTRKMHLFDPATGENLTVDLEDAGRAHPATPSRKQPASRLRLAAKRMPAPSRSARLDIAATRSHLG